MNTAKAKTYIYIDVSNIRSSCLRSCGFQIDFHKLYNYLQQKYPNTQEVRFYEGISPNDREKIKQHRSLTELGYTICALQRKCYWERPICTSVVCKKCGAKQRVQVAPPARKLKSNVDVFLASDLLERAAKSWRPIQIILLSCDGDYAEAIHAALRLNHRARIIVLATPKTAKNNCLSDRLKKLSRELDRSSFQLLNINDIRGKIEKTP